ncbi:MAG: pyruvate formate lyase family protein [Verrucomicrobiae bacterium]
MEQATLTQSPRIRVLAQRNRELAVSGKRRLGSGAMSPGGEDMSFGDHACWIDIGPFPELEEMPSRKNGYEATGESWGRDYAFLVDHFPAAIHEHERIVGEIHWEMHMVRQYVWPESVLEAAQAAEELGASGMSNLHTCPDLAIGLSQGWGGILERIKRSRAKYTSLANPSKASYLHGLEMICESVIRFIERHAEQALAASKRETDAGRAAELRRIAECCAHIARQPPRTYYEGVQWIHFAVLLDRVVGHGNGYGRLDLYLIDLYRQSKAAGELSDDEAREYLAEMFLKLRGHFFSMGGRDAQLQDATNEMSFVVLEAYDLIGDYNNLGVMWHPDIDPAFYDYACDVLARHGESVPVLVNYDLMRAAELRSGIPEDDAWKVAYSGCQWFCIPGKESCDQDSNLINLIKPMKRAIAAGVERGLDDFDSLYALFEEELRRTAGALRDVKNRQYELLGNLWPEMFTSMNSHGPIERGLDMVAPRGVDYQFTSVNVLGIPNVADSLHAILKLVFERHQYSLGEVQVATESNWSGREPMRQRFLHEDKFGNDLDEVDALFVRITESLDSIVGSMVNLRGQEFRPSLYSFNFHVTPTDPASLQTFRADIGATPDGRLAEEHLAHGINPQLGRNTRGLLPTANSMAKADQRKFQGGTLQLDLPPSFFAGSEQVGPHIRDFSTAFFRQGGIQVNLNIMDPDTLRDAMVHPENPAYHNIVIRVTGYASRFICLNRSYQIEFIERLTEAKSAG